MMHSSFYKVLIAASLLTTAVQAQTKTYTVQDAHSHNDYLNDIPFLRAYHKGFGSIEADIYSVKGELYVAHDKEKISPEKTLSNLYLKPVSEALSKDNTRQLSLLIDIKENHQEVLPILVKQLKPLQALLSTPGNQRQLTIIISGDRPAPANYKNYPDYIFFDDNRRAAHTPEEWKRIALVSDEFKKYTSWNGKGVIPKAELSRVKGLIDSVHAAGRKLRFWAVPDGKTAWLSLMDLGVDVIGTDKVEELGTLLKNRKSTQYQNPTPYNVYKPTYRSDGKSGKVKNIIFLIGDGMGLTQVYATYTANRGQLNMFQMQNIGLSMTTSADAYGTDSAAGATAMATGEKTNNRAVGVDPADKPLKSLAVYAAEAKKKTAVIAACDITDATPAAFYGHQPERSSGKAIAQDFLSSPIDMLLGSGRVHFEANQNGSSTIAQLQAKGYSVVGTMSEFLSSNAPKLIGLMPDSVTRPMLKGRGDFLLSSFKKVTDRYAKEKNGFFMMLEGSQIDHGGHANNFSQVVTENMDFDQVVGEALKFADEDGQTLVVVTADHETGGLTLLNGNISKGYIQGEFSTDDHTGIPVPVYAYGPHSDEFRGVYQNTEIFKKLQSLLKNQKAKLQ